MERNRSLLLNVILAAVVGLACLCVLLWRTFAPATVLPELNVPALRAFGERVALNMPIQGTAADVIKLAMVHVDKRLRAEGMKAKLILQVHDELIVECPEAEREKAVQVLCEEMEHAVAYTVPLTADAGWGRNWAEAHGT